MTPTLMMKILKCQILVNIFIIISSPHLNYIKKLQFIKEKLKNELGNHWFETKTEIGTTFHVPNRYQNHFLHGLIPLQFSNCRI